ncbi:unnamed protein product (plasmid) [Mycetohabitans rhizoxinica HKI 454]|uniref:Uncharacterized protein n=1 Tax=Mycetohabitans rhizoxinica (strain DSM 19002 / CIP 109453 / HKI 454) TaxID=882378 RepID=E5ATQ7_MYCRK|nr:unnamed protein product [Mycetohabitans rhizoxinica HKI 454]
MRDACHDDALVLSERTLLMRADVLCNGSPAA